MRLQRLLHSYNFPKMVCDHTFGKHHSHVHRIAAGTGVMFVGVMTASAAAEIHIFALHIIGDLVGYLLHGAGAIPIIDFAIEKSNERE